MADGGRISAFPLPPMHYVNQYSDERVQTGSAPRPPRPLDSNYAMFGAPCTKEDAVIHSLESQGIRRLYPALFDHKRELKKLNFSILANYLDLMDIVVKCPDSQERLQKLEHMKTLFINVHHLINEYRPLQARDTLIEMLALQSSVTRQAVDTASRYLAKADDIVRKAAAAIDDDEAMTEASAGGSGEISHALLNDIDRLSAELAELTSAAAELDGAPDGEPADAAADAAAEADEAEAEDIELESESDETSEENETPEEAEEQNEFVNQTHGIASYSNANDEEASGTLEASGELDLDSLLGPAGMDFGSGF